MSWPSSRPATSPAWRDVLRTVALGVLAFVLAPTGSGRAQELAGALSGHLVVNDSQPIDAGAAGTLDLWASFDWFGVGGFVGVTSLPSNNDARNVTFMPLGLSMMARARLADPIVLDVRIRLGGWGGATQSEKLTGGIYLGAGPHFGLRIGGGVAIHLGVDLAGLLATELWEPMLADGAVPSASQLLIMPTLGLSWDPNEAQEPTGDE